MKILLVIIITVFVTLLAVRFITPAPPVVEPATASKPGDLGLEEAAAIKEMQHRKELREAQEFMRKEKK